MLTRSYMAKARNIITSVVKVGRNSNPPTKQLNVFFVTSQQLMKQTKCLEDLSQALIKYLCLTQNEVLNKVSPFYLYIERDNPQNLLRKWRNFTAAPFLMYIKYHLLYWAFLPLKYGRNVITSTSQR